MHVEPNNVSSLKLSLPLLMRQALTHRIGGLENSLCSIGSTSKLTHRIGGLEMLALQIFY